MSFINLLRQHSDKFITFITFDSVIKIPYIVEYMRAYGFSTVVNSFNEEFAAADRGVIDLRELPVKYSAAEVEDLFDQVLQTELYTDNPEKCARYGFLCDYLGSQFYKHMYYLRLVDYARLACNSRYISSSPEINCDVCNSPRKHKVYIMDVLEIETYRKRLAEERKYLMPLIAPIYNNIVNCTDIKKFINNVGLLFTKVEI